jgi:hypothetical protein
MEISSTYGDVIHFTSEFRLALWFLLIWPFVAFWFFRRDGRSPAPIAAVVVAIAVVQAALWLALASHLRFAGVLYGSPLSFAWVLLWPVGWIVLFALLRRHRPVPDRFALVLGVLVLAMSIAIRLFMTRVGSVVTAQGAGAVSLVIAAAAVAWLVRARVQRA